MKKKNLLLFVASLFIFACCGNQGALPTKKRTSIDKDLNNIEYTCDLKK